MDNLLGIPGLRVASSVIGNIGCGLTGFLVLANHWLSVPERVSGFVTELQSERRRKSRILKRYRDLTGFRYLKDDWNAF